MTRFRLSLPRFRLSATVLSFFGAASVPFLRSFVRGPTVIPAFYPTRHAGDASRKIVIIGRRGLLPTAVFLCIFGRQNAPANPADVCDVYFKPYAYAFLRSRRQCFLFVTAILIYDRRMAGLNVKLKVNMLRRQHIALALFRAHGGNLKSFGDISLSYDLSGRRIKKVNGKKKNLKRLALKVVRFRFRVALVNKNATLPFAPQLCVYYSKIYKCRQ